MNTETKQRTVPYYACEHGTPGGCSWCRAVDQSRKQTLELDAMRAALEETLRALFVHEGNSEAVMRARAALTK